MSTVEFFDTCNLLSFILLNCFNPIREEIRGEEKLSCLISRGRVEFPLVRLPSFQYGPFVNRHCCDLI